MLGNDLLTNMGKDKQVEMCSVFTKNFSNELNVFY